jgi:hypothetical protein
VVNHKKGNHKLHKAKDKHYMVGSESSEETLNFFLHSSEGEENDNYCFQQEDLTELQDYSELAYELNYDFDSNKYTNLQRTLYEELYSSDCLDSITESNFISSMNKSSIISYDSRNFEFYFEEIV